LFTQTSPSSGTAAISVRLKEFATAIYTNRFTTLTANVEHAGARIRRANFESGDGRRGG